MPLLSCVFFFVLNRSAEKDITRAHSLCPTDKGIDREIQALHAQRRSALRDEKTIAVQMYGTSGNHTDERTTTQSTTGHDTDGDTGEYTASDLVEDEKQEMAQWSMSGRGGTQRAKTTATGSGDGGSSRTGRMNSSAGGNRTSGGTTTTTSSAIMAMSCLNVAVVSECILMLAGDFCCSYCSLMLILSCLYLVLSVIP